MPVTKEDRAQAAKAGMQNQDTKEQLSAKEGLPKRRILTMEDGMMRIHPDDMGPIYPGLVVLREQYAPSLEDFEKKFGALSADSPTRKTYTEKPRQTPTSDKK